MSRTSGWLLTLLLAVSNMAFAEERDLPLVDIVTVRDQWQPVNPETTPEDYRKLSRNNLRLARHALTSYSQERLTSMGASVTGINLLGAAIGLATSGASIPVNKSKTMAVELENMADDKRALVFRVKLDW